MQNQKARFERILENINGNRLYAVDIANSKMRLIGAPASALTMYLWYLYVPTSLFGLTDAQKASSSTIVWPARFHRILAYKMAEILFGGIVTDDTNRSMAPAQRAEYEMLKKAMVKWDNAIRLQMMGGSSAAQRRERGVAADVVTWP